MQPPESPIRRPEPRGWEAWLPPIALGIVQIVVAAALLWFVFVARSVQGRISLPSWVIPASIAGAAAFAVYLLLRAAWNLQRVLRHLRSRR